MIKSFFLDQKWLYWSYLGLTIIMLSIWFSVELKIQLNTWTGDFYNLIQTAFTKPKTINSLTIYKSCLSFILITLSYGILNEALSYFSKIYTFKWRTASNQFYLQQWEKINVVEGIAQRVHEDTARYAELIEILFQKIVKSILILFMFLPIVISLGQNVLEIPILGTTENAITKSCFFIVLLGSSLIAVSSKKIPQIEMNRQKQEAAYRKALVYEENEIKIKNSSQLEKIYNLIQKCYYKICQKYFFTNCIKELYIKFNYIMPYFVLTPTILSGLITLGIIKQIISAVSEVNDALACLIYAYQEIIEIIAIHLRLKEVDLLFSK